VLLTLEQVAKACEISIAAGADFAKPPLASTANGATVEQVEVI
jgi:deoxyribose-phosphate aldolase